MTMSKSTGAMWPWLALVLATAGPALADEKHARELIEERCALCHGMEGETASPVYPRLAGQHPRYIAKQLQDFRTGRRFGETMNEMSKDLQDDEIEILSRFFAARPAGHRAPADEDLAAVGRYVYLKGNPYSGVAACSSCHGEQGHGNEKMPRLAGQHPSYLDTQLREFSRRERTNDNAVMQAIAAKLTELERKAVASYLGGLR